MVLMMLISGCIRTQLTDSTDTFCAIYSVVPLTHKEIDNCLSDQAKIALDNNSEAFKKLCLNKENK